jgi:hypothetical protein
VNAGGDAAGHRPPDFGSGPGVRARVREYRLALLRIVLEQAEAPLRYEDAAERLALADGVGIPLRTLKEPPFADLISAQTPRRGRNGELSGIPWRLRRFSPGGLASHKAGIEARLRAMQIDLPDVVPHDRGPEADERERLQQVWDMELLIEARAREHGLAIAANMRERLLERRGVIAARREGAITLAYRELRLTAPSGRNR